MLKSGFYSEGFPGNVGVWDGPTSDNYRPYDLFSVKTRLISAIHRQFPELKPAITFEYKVFDQRQVVYFNLNINVTDQQRDQIQGILSELSTDTSQLLLFDTELINTFPKYWLVTIFSELVDYTISLSKLYSVNLSFPEAEVFNDDTRIYISFNQEIIDDEFPYTDVYNEMFDKLLFHITDFYNKGVVYIPEKLRDSIICNWSLVKVAEDLYMPSWSDHRFAPNLCEFMLKILSGDKTITFYQYLNQVYRHNIAEYLSSEGIPFSFEYRSWDGKDKVFCQFNEPFNLEEVQMTASIISTAIDRSYGDVRIFEYSDIEAAERSATHFRSQDSSVIIYQISDPQLPFVTSVLS